MLVTEPDDLNLITETHMVEEENQFLKLSSDLHTHMLWHDKQL